LSLHTRSALKMKKRSYFKKTFSNRLIMMHITRQDSEDTFKIEKNICILKHKLCVPKIEVIRSVLFILFPHFFIFWKLNTQFSTFKFLFTLNVGISVIFLLVKYWQSSYLDTAALVIFLFNHTNNNLFFYNGAHNTRITIQLGNTDIISWKFFVISACESCVKHIFLNMF